MPLTPRVQARPAATKTDPGYFFPEGVTRAQAPEQAGSEGILWGLDCSLGKRAVEPSRVAPRSRAACPVDMDWVKAPASRHGRHQPRGGGDSPRTPSAVIPDRLTLRHSGWKKEA